MKNHNKKARLQIKYLRYLNNKKWSYSLVQLILKALPRIFLEGLLIYNYGALKM